MHEMSLCASMVQIIEEQAREQGFSRVRRVWLEIGPLAGVEVAAMRFGFDVVTRGTLAENATLEILETQAEAWCMACSKQVPVTQRFDACPECGGFQLQVTGGEELRIKELEVD